MPTDKRQLRRQRPVAVNSMEVGVADARVLDVDENFIWAGLGDGNLLVLHGTPGGLDDAGPLLGGDLG